jgi:rhodanese-related sulfurtransferase
MKRWGRKILLTCTVGLALFGIAGQALLAQEFAKVKAEVLKQWIESGDNTILIVDVQPQGAYKLGHIKGAVNFPWAADLKSPGDLPRDKTLILYCDCPHEEDSQDVANQLNEKWGYGNIKLLERGWSNWLKMGYPTEK